MQTAKLPAGQIKEDDYTELMGYEGGAPAPLAPLQHVIISERNQRMAEQRDRAIVLPKRDFKIIAKQVEKLESALEKANYAGIRTIYSETLTEVQVIIDEHYPGQLPTAARVKELSLSLQEIDTDESRRTLTVLRRWTHISRQMRPLMPTAREYKRLRQQIEDHWVADERDRAQKRLEHALFKECRWYEHAIIRTWERLKFYQDVPLRNGRMRRRVPRFSQRDFGLDKHQFKIDALFEGFRGVGTNMPEGVYVIKDLLSPDTLDELTIALQRQVTAEFDARNGSAGAWVIVNRLEHVDGLMNYVTFEDVMKYYPNHEPHKLPLCIGVGENRKVEYFYLAEFAHWLIAGLTGAGKSNLVNVLICTMIQKYSPQNLRLVLIDLKEGLEFTAYERVPHLHGKIVANIEQAVQTLDQLEGIMRERFKRFRGVARSWEAYRMLRPDEYMPRVVCVIDEVAELAERGEISKNSNAHLREIARLGRAVGIHLILCTQRPDVQAVSGAIKINLPVRIAGLMPASQDSVTVLGNNAATKLSNVKGRMVAQIGNVTKQVQTPHITEEMIEHAIATAYQFAAAPVLDMPQAANAVTDAWTVEKVIELSIKHMNGNVSWRRIYEAAEGMSQSQARKLAETIWAMDGIEFDGKKYHCTTGTSNTHWIRLIESETR